MSKKIGVILALGLMALFALGAILVPVRLMASPEQIRASLLAQMPLGSKRDDVRTFVDKQGWLDHSYLGETSGFLKQESGKENTVVGVSSLKGNLGHYYLPLRTDVTAFWGFDRENHLIDVWVWKTVDAP